MWWAGKRRDTTLHLGAASLHVVDKETVTVAAIDASPEALMASLVDAALTLRRRVRVRLLLSGAWCQPFILPEVAGVKNEVEWQRVASGLVPVLTGLPPDSTVWLDPDQRSPHLAVALHPLVASAIQPLKLTQVRPWWREAMASLPPSVRGLVALADTDALTLLQCDDGLTFTAAQTYLLNGDSVDDVLTRSLISRGLSAPVADVRLDPVTLRTLTAEKQA